MSAATASAASTRTARFVVAGAGWFAAWGVAAGLGVPRSVEVALALYGFVFHVLFGKAYALVPSYFDRNLATPRAPAVHLPLAVGGTALLAAAPLVGGVPLELAGSVLWGAGAVVFVGALAWTVRDNPTGAETGTGDHRAHLRELDRRANAFVPVALAYLLAGAAARVAIAADLPTPVPYGAAATHLLAAGAATMFVLAVGFRLLPRFLVVDPPQRLATLVLPAGALGPMLLVTDFGGGSVFRLGAVLEGVTVVGFAAAVLAMVRRSDRRRVGFTGVALAAVAGVLAVGLGLQFAFVGGGAGEALAHARLNLVGFLGLTVVGITYQFYPPAVGTYPGAGDRTALVSIVAVALGLAASAGGLLAGARVVTLAGTALAGVGCALYAYLVLGLVRQRQ